MKKKILSFYTLFVYYILLLLFLKYAAGALFVGSLWTVFLYAAITHCPITSKVKNEKGMDIYFFSDFSPLCADPLLQPDYLFSHPTISF